MGRFYGFMAKFCSCLGVALLLCSIAVVPSGGLFADDGEPGVPVDVTFGCGQDKCDNGGCKGSIPSGDPPLCNVVAGSCDNPNPPGTDCRGCKCKPFQDKTKNPPEPGCSCRVSSQ